MVEQSSPYDAILHISAFCAETCTLSYNHFQLFVLLQLCDDSSYLLAFSHLAPSALLNFTQNFRTDPRFTNSELSLASAALKCYVFPHRQYSDFLYLVLW